MTTIGQPIVCKAAVAWAANEPLKVEMVTVAPPKAGEVMVDEEKKEKGGVKKVCKRMNLSDVNSV